MATIFQHVNGEVNGGVKNVKGHSRDINAEAKAQLKKLDGQLEDLEQYLPTTSPDKLGPSLEIWNAIYDFIGFSTFDAELEKAILVQPETPAIVQRLRADLVTVEAALEIETADKMDLAKSPEEALKILKAGVHNIFYQCMCPLEWGALLSVLGGPPKSVVIMGSGSLPETGIWILDWARNNGAKIHICNVDLIAERVERSKRVYKSLDLMDHVSFAAGDARSTPENLAEYDVVYYNVTVGRDEVEKEDILVDVVSRMKKGGIVMSRSTNSIKTMSFPSMSIQTPRLLEKLAPVLHLHSNGHKYDSINASMIVSRVL